MGIFEYLLVFLSSLPALALWIAVIIFGAVKLKRGGGRAERFLIVGAGLKIIGNLLGAATVLIIPHLFNAGYIGDYFYSFQMTYGLFVNVIGMAGFICLIYAFWVKFQARKTEEKESPELERGSYDAIPE